MESLSEPFIKRPVLTALLSISAVLAGIFCYWLLPVSDLPNVDYPVIQVTAAFPGMDPLTMSSNVAAPLEKEFMKISGLELVTSTSMTGQTNITLQFDLDKNIDGAATDVQAAITRASGNLPADMPAQPTFKKTDPNSQPIYYLALTSNTMSRSALYDYATNEIAQRISILKGVSDASVYGVARAVRILIDPEKLYNKGLAVDDIAKAVQSGTVSLAAGSIKGQHKTLILKPQGQLMYATDYMNLVVACHNSYPVYLKDVADCIDSVESEDFQNNLWVNGNKVPFESSTMVAVTKAAGANAVELSKSIDDMLPIFKEQMPGSIELVKVYDRSKKIIESINDVKETLCIAFVLVILVIFLFLGRVLETIIPAIALPLSLFITFIVMKLLNFSIDNLSLMALTLSIGFLVDDAIVFLENMIRRMEVYGETPLQASKNGAKEITFTILSMTLSLAAVFIPLVFMAGQVGRIFREFSITIVVAIIASGLVSLTLTPMMCARMLKGIDINNRTKLEDWSKKLEGKILNWYGKILTWFLKKRKLSVGIWVTCLLGTGLIFMYLPKSFLPAGDSGVFNGVFIAQEGTSAYQMQGYQKQLDQILNNMPELGKSLTLTGLSSMLSSNQGMLIAFAKDGGHRKTIQEINKRFLAASYSIPGIMVFTTPMPNLSISTGAISTNQGKYAYILSGINTQDLYKAANDLMTVLRSNKGFSSVSSDLFMNNPQITIDYLHQQAYSYGIVPYQIENMFKNAYSENYCYQIKDLTQQYKVIVSVNKEMRNDVNDLKFIYFKNQIGELVPFDSVAKAYESIGALTVNHTNNFPSVTIFFNLRDDYPVGEATKFLLENAKKIVPQSLQGSLRGEAQAFQSTVQSLTVLLFVAIFVMYVILGILYESYIHPLTVLSALPIALFGGLVTLFVFRMELSLYAYIGLFMLLGIVKKNGIMMVDFAIMRKNEGMSTEDAVHKACLERFRPIIMTTLAALMGAVPIAAGWGADGVSRIPLGFCVVGGLVISQIITLFVTPVLYIIFEEFQENVLDKIPFFAREVSE